MNRVPFIPAASARPASARPASGVDLGSARRYAPVRMIVFLKTGRFVLALLSTFLMLAPGCRLGADDAAVQTGSLGEAVDLYYAGDFDDALAMLRGIVAAEPDDTPARRNLVRLLREAGELGEALEHLSALAEAEPQDGRLRAEQERVSYLAGVRPRTGSLESGPAGPELPRDELAELLFWRGLALADAGDRSAAEESLEASLELEPYRPYAWFELGRISLEAGLYGQAEERLNTALRQEPNLTAAFHPLALAMIGRDRVTPAHGLLGRASSSMPWNEPVRQTLRALEEAHPALIAADEAERVARREVTTPPVASPLAEDRESIPTVRVGLAEGLREVHAKAGGSFRLVSAGAGSHPGMTVVAEGEADALLTVTHDGGEVVVADEQGFVLVRVPAAVRLVYDEPTATTALFDMEYGTGYFFAGRADRFYRGDIEFLPGPDGVTVVNELNVEEYLYSTVPSEMPASWPAAALEAQAIAARTYTFANMGRHASRGFDLFASVASASYQGFGNERRSTDDAVNATRGLVLMAGARLVNTVYSANSGGHTESSASVWGFPSTLVAVADPMLEERTGPLAPDDLARWVESRPMTHSSHPRYSGRAAYRWTLHVPVADIASRPGSNVKLGQIVSITTRGRGISGRVEEVLIRGTDGQTTVRGDAIRNRLGGLRSNLFTVEPRLGTDGLPQAFIFSGAGWGHGVGMDQSGAAGMAAAGYGAEAILAHYYRGAELVRRY